MVKPCVKPLREGLRADIGAEVDGVHAVDHLPQRFEIGVDRRALAVGDIAAKPDEDTVPDHLLVPSSGPVARKHRRRQRLAAAHEVGPLLADHDRRRIGVGGGTRGMTEASQTRNPSMPRT